MSRIGKAVRLAQIINQDSGRCVIVAMDHCPAIGPCDGMVNPIDTVAKICEGHPDTLFMHRGNLAKTYDLLAKARIPFLLSISTATTIGPTPDRVYLVDTVENAVKVGASGVSMRTFVGPEFEHEMIGNLGRVSAQCEEHGLLLMAMMYPNGFENDFDPKYVKHAARIAGGRTSRDCLARRRQRRGRLPGRGPAGPTEGSRSAGKRAGEPDRRFRVRRPHGCLRAGTSPQRIRGRPHGGRDGCPL